MQDIGLSIDLRAGEFDDACPFLRFGGDEGIKFARAHDHRRLGISGPTLTHQIQKLEGQLGARLLQRKGNSGVVITEAGQRFFGIPLHSLSDTPANLVYDGERSFGSEV